MSNDKLVITVDDENSQIAIDAGGRTFNEVLAMLVVMPIKQAQANGFSKEKYMAMADFAWDKNLKK